MCFSYWWCELKHFCGIGERFKEAVDGLCRGFGAEADAQGGVDILLVEAHGGQYMALLASGAGRAAADIKAAVAEDALLQVTENFVEPVPGAREKLIKVLEVMLTTWIANLLKAKVDHMIEEL